MVLLMIVATPLGAQQTPGMGDSSKGSDRETAAPETDAEQSDPADPKALPRLRFQMDEVVVTATRAEDVIRRIPRNVSVITADDIAQAPGNRIADLLARETGLNLQSFFGHDKGAQIDIRGMGETASSNVIVMVDGFRLNTPDLAGPDYAVIPIDQIERIEVVRGAGSVLYGDGATGGVINIITKRGEGDRAYNAYGSYGSYDTYDARASTSGELGPLRYRLNSAYYDSDGYRDNNDFWKRDLGTVFDFDISDTLSASLGYAYHKDKIGLPGPVPASFNSSSRRKDTRFPDDYSRTTEHRFNGGMEVEMDQWGLLRLDVTYRDRDNPYIQGYNSLLPNAEQTDKIKEDTIQTNLVYSNTFRLFERDQNFRSGVDFFYTDYVRDEFEATRRHRDVYKTEGFFHGELALQGDIIVTTGFRKSYYKGNFRDDTFEDFFTVPPPPPPLIPPEYLYSAWVRGESRDETWQNEAWDLGLTWLADENTSLFASVAQTYRIPNVDELTLAVEDLEPQTGYHADLGLRTQLPGLLEVNLTLFWIEIEDEIYYGEIPGPSRQRLNRNYDEKTRRQGVEVDMRLYPTESIYLRGNFAYVDAEFKGSSNNIPLVPAFKGSVSLEYQPLEPLTLSLVGKFVGSSYDGNDQSNDRFDKLGSYNVFDSKLSYEYRGVKLFGGVNNILNDKYATVSFSEFLYPMPERNGYVGLEWDF